MTKFWRGFDFGYRTFIYDFRIRHPPKRLLPPSIPISQPVRSQNFGVLSSPCTAHIHSKEDLLVWFEIWELGKNTSKTFFHIALSIK